jgi:hypothetical protein
MVELSLARGFTVRLRLGAGIQQRERGLRLGCAAKKLFSSTMSGSTVGMAEEQDFPSPRIWVRAPGRFGSMLGLVLGYAVPVLFLVRGSALVPTRLALSIQCSRADCGRHSKFVEHPPEAKPRLTTKNERSE